MREKKPDGRTATTQDTPLDNGIDADATEKTKVPYEIEVLRATARSTRITVVFTATTTLVVVLNFASDIHKTREITRRDNIEKRLARMRTIASDFQELQGFTVTTLRRDQEKASLVVAAFADFDRQFSASDAPTKQSLERSKQALDALRQQFSQQFQSFEIWAPETALAEKWNGRKVSFAPDFAPVFGDDVNAQWVPLRTAAIDAFEEKFSVFGDPGPLIRLCQIQRRGAAVE